MTVLFTSIVFEAKISGAWADISADVLADPKPTWNMGITGDGPADRLGDVEILTFSLNNSVTNSGGLAGYYSPGHTNCRTGWTTGIDVRLSFVYDGATYYKYFGSIDPDGILPEPGEKGPRSVAVTCSGYMGRTQNHNINLLSIAEDQTLEEAAALLLANMPIAPVATDYGTGASTFPTVFDTVGESTSVNAELNKLAISELGYVYTKGDKTGGQTFTVRGRDDFAGLSNTDIPIVSSSAGYLKTEDGDYVLTETSDKIILDLTTTASFDNTMLPGMQVMHGKHMANRIKTKAYPRRVDAAATTVLWSLENAMEIKAGETKTGIRGTYRDPTGGSKSVKGKDMVTPVSGTDFVGNSASDGSGTSKTAQLTVTAEFGASDVEFTITNADAASVWTGGDAGAFQIRGKGIYFYDVVSNVTNDTNSQVTLNYGVKEMTFDMPYQDDAVVTEAFAQYELNQLKEPYTTIERIPLSAHRDDMSMAAFLALEPGTKAEFIEDQTAINGNYFIMGYDAEIVGGKYVFWYPVLVRESDMDFTEWENGYKRITENFTGATEGDTIFGWSGIGAVSGGAAAPWTNPVTGKTGIWYFVTSASNYSGAYMEYLSSTYTLAQGGLEVILYFYPLHANVTGAFGVTDGSSNNIVCQIDTSLSFEGAVNGSATSTSYTLSINTWYRGKVRINQAGTLATFYLYDDNGTLLWSDTKNSGFPSSTTAMSPYIRFIYSITPSPSTELILVDYFTAGYVHD